MLRTAPGVAVVPQVKRTRGSARKGATTAGVSSVELIVDNEQFDLCVVLRQHAGNGAGQVAAVVIGGNGNRNQGHAVSVSGGHVVLGRWSTRMVRRSLLWSWRSSA